MIERIITILFTKSISPKFYPGQILLAVRLKICLLRPNSTQEVRRDTIVLLPTLLSCSSRFLRALQQKRAYSRLLYLLSIIQFRYQYRLRTDHESYHKSLILRSLRRKNDRACEQIHAIATTNYSYLKTSAINVSDQDYVHVAIAIN